ncbi:restriction endonuclease subunit S [Paracoccus sp. JM45]|uniref:restriction endonuclease subunit S n=1 Tax=Paracoccus sp. JM45 TaxID=2283626 RepID=UPI000E6BD820|nr:restriction endonuclease subunit S [Paracoccus sp. JM45]RJE80016.1 restriction endonuclease subunit S [Paracoccus sp. JM45]
MSGGWTSKPLGQIVTLQRGFDLPKRLRVDGEVPIISSSGPEDWHNEPIKIGPGLVTGRYGTIGKVFFVDGPYWPLNTTLFVSNFHGNNPRFCYYLLQRFDFAGQSGKTGVPGVNRNDLHAIKVLAPDDLPEQQAIAAALSDADGVVAGLERVIAKKRLIKQGAMQDLLTARRRLPGFSGEWEVRKLGGLGVCLRGVSYDGSADLFETETPASIMLLRANNVQNGKIVYSDVQHVRKDRVKQVQHLKRGDVLVCMANGSRALVGKAGIFWDEDGSAYTFGAFMGCFRPTAGAAADGYVPFLLQSDEYRNQLNVILSGSAINNLAPSQILGFSFTMPVDHKEQQAIAAVLSDMDAEIQTLESRLAKARLVKEGMMQNLLTGRVRLV